MRTPQLPPGRLGFSPTELRQLFPLSRNGAYALARRLGVREGRKLIVPRAALEEWLRTAPRAAQEPEVQP